MCLLQKALPYCLALFCLYFSGCAKHVVEPETPFTPKAVTQPLNRMNIVTHANLTETITSTERLKEYAKRDFLGPQPYKKVMRIFNRDSQGSTKSLITSYYENGQIQQYLECVNGRACGLYLEWYSNGLQKTQAHLLSGQADIDEKSFISWSFDGDCNTFDEQGNITALYHYDGGVLQGNSETFYPDGQKRSTTSYKNGLKDGIEMFYAKDGSLIQTVTYAEDLRNGTATGYSPLKSILWNEEYRGDYLHQAEYFSSNNTLLSSVIEGNGTRCVYDEGVVIGKEEIKNGQPDGCTELYDEEGCIERKYEVHDGVKNGIETRYYAGTSIPRISIQWRNGVVHGTVKTWYDTGVLESQREISQNLKNGVSMGWYKDGSIMLVEEYVSDKLTRGQYMKKGENDPISRIEDGCGIATLFDINGTVVEKIQYKDGRPIVEES